MIAKAKAAALALAFFWGGLAFYTVDAGGEPSAALSLPSLSGVGKRGMASATGEPYSSGH